MDNPTRDHGSHDPALISALAAGDLIDTARARAQALVERCTSCAALERDLIAIARATRELPTLAMSSRDYRLTADQAAALRPRGGWRAILEPFAGARRATRSVAAACTSLGLVGVLVATVLPGLTGGATMLAPSAEQPGTRGAPTAGPAGPALGPGVDHGGQPAPDPTGDAVPGTNGQKGSTAPEAGAAGAPAPTTAGDFLTGTGDVQRPANLLMVGSVGLLSVGLLLFAMRIAARRLRM